MVRPKNFGYNAETAENNAFQSSEGANEVDRIKQSALEEFDNMVKTLERHDIKVIVVEDTETPLKSDAVFPNNWFSTHSNGNIITYPMNAESRRAERREDIVDKLTLDYGYKKRYGFEYLEEDEQFLEGTGSMILDRDNRVVYACISPRTDIKALDKFAVLQNFEKIIFHATDGEGQLIYHTNVMMALGIDFVVICMDSIQDSTEKESVLDKLNATGKELIDISIEQMNHFAGNMLQVRSQLGEPYLIMSQEAYDSLTGAQLEQIAKRTKYISIPIPVIEKYGGGSVRCMMAEIFPTRS